MTPVKKFREMPETSAFDAKIKKVIADLERAGTKWYRIMGADVPLTGHRNYAATNTLIQVVKEGWDYYPGETNCRYDFKEAVTIFQKRHRNVDYCPEDIIPVPGVASGWQLIHNVILESGDEIVALEPAHYMWGPVSYMYYLGAKIVQVPTIEENGWEPDYEKLRACVTQKTKAIVIDHPNNPTGHIYSAKARRAVVDIAGEYRVPVISDELYGLITFDGNEAPSMASVSDDVPVIVLTSFSKSFMKPGWRIGYIAFHDPHGKIAEAKKVCTKLAETYGHATTCIPLPIMVAATRVLTSMIAVSDEISEAKSIKAPMDESRQMIKKLQKQRDYSFKRINEIDGVTVVKPQASLYMFPRVEAIGKTWKITEDFILDLLTEKQVGFLSGPRFGDSGAGHFRTMFLNKVETLEEVYNRLEAFIKQRLGS